LPIKYDIYFIIANTNKELFQYEKRTGFKSCNVSSVEDIAYDSERGILYFVQDNKLKYINYNDIDESDINKVIRDFAYCKNIYISPFSHKIFLIEKDYLNKLADNKISISTYNVSGIKSDLFAVDKNDDIYFCKENKIIKIKKQGKEELLYEKSPTDSEISSIPIDSEDRIWALDKKNTSILIINTNGKKIIDFRYDQEDRFPFFLFILNNKIFIIDKWEGIIVYSLDSITSSSEGRFATLK
jgi:hypothetical protein